MNIMQNDCNTCIFKKITYDEIERLRTENVKLKAENASLLKEQNTSILLMDLTLSAVKLWGQQNGLIDKEEDPAGEFASRHDKTDLFLKQIEKTDMKEMGIRLVEILDKLEKGI